MTEIGTLPQEWDVARLGDAVSVYDKQRIPLRSEDRQGMQGGFPYCGANGIIDHINQYIFDGEFVLLAEDGGYWHSFEESSYVMNGKFWVNNHAHILAAIDGKAANYYLMYALNYLDISVFIGGTTRGKLTQGVMKAIPIPLPPLPEQKAITRVLSTIQLAIETQDKIIAAARELKKSLMRHLFTYGPVPVTEADKVLLKETEIGPVPERWQVVRLGQKCDVKGGKRLPKGHAFSDKPTPHPYIRVIDFRGGSVDLSNLKFLTDEDYQTIRRYTINTDEVYISIAGTIGLIGTIPNELSGANLTENAAKLVIKEKSELNNIFLKYALSTENLRQQIFKLTTKTSQPKLALSRIQQIIIPLPLTSEQQEIVNMLSAVDKKIEAEENRKSALQALFKTMLHHLMTGKVRVNHLEAEV